MKRVTTNGWSDYQKLIIFRLDEQDKTLKLVVGTVDKVKDKVNDINTSLTLVKFKISMLGGAAGLFISMLYQWVIK